MENHTKSQKPLQERFKQGCVLIFKKWSAFRLALDNNPRVLTYYNEDQTVLEINEMLQTLYEELYSTINSGSLSGQSLIDELSDCLYGFMNDYFNIILEDQSDSEIACDLIKLYNQLKNGDDTMLNSLANYKNTLIQYSVDFPILGNQKIIFEKGDDEEEEEEDMEEEKDNNHGNNQNNNAMDEDGFVEVKKKGKGF